MKLTVGSRGPLGSIILAIRYASITDERDPLRQDYVILCSGVNEFASYATWRHGGEGNGGYWGHYFRTLADAWKDFCTR